MSDESAEVLSEVIRAALATPPTVQRETKESE